jgi:hypothetical protein
VQRGHIILIAGAALLVAGIAITAVWGTSFASTFLAENTIVAERSIEPGESVNVRMAINALDRPLSLAIGVDRQQSSGDVRLRETVTDPTGEIVSSSEFDESFFTTIQPEATGTYTATLTNIGTQTASISGTFGYMPFVSADGRPNVDEMMSGSGLGMVIVGGGLAAAGVVTLIVGGIITVLDSRKHETTTTSEGGVTYRKD